MEKGSFFEKLTETIIKDEGMSAVDARLQKSKKWLSDSEAELPLDVYQTDTDIVIKSLLPGVRVSDIDLSIVNDILTIKGTRSKDEETREQDYYYRECSWGSFSRSVILPFSIKTDQIKASLKNGVLTIRLPKATIAASQKVSVTSSI